MKKALLLINVLCLREIEFAMEFWECGTMWWYVFQLEFTRLFACFMKMRYLSYVVNTTSCVVNIMVLTHSNIPNRSTFVCPYCGARNLDQQELVKHCMENHRNDPNRVVSLPAGWYAISRAQDVSEADLAERDGEKHYTFIHELLYSGDTVFFSF